MPDETPHGDLPGQSGGLNIEGSTSIGGNAVGRDSINQTTTNTTTTNTTIAEGGPVARYAVIGMIVIAALAIIIVALLASQGRPPLPVATATSTPSLTVPPAPSPTASATVTPSPLPPTATPTEPPTPPPTQPPTDTPLPPTATPLPPTETLSPSPSPTTANAQPLSPTAPAAPSATPTPSATATEAVSPTPSPTPLLVSSLPLYDNFASNCLNREKWMLDWVWQSPLPTPGAPVCLVTRPQFMAADDGLIVFIDSTVVLTKSVTHALTSAQLGYFKQVDVTFTLNNVDVFTDTRTAYLSAGVSVPLARPADADLEVRLQGSNATGKFGYQITSLLNLKDGSGNISGGKMPYTPGQPVLVSFRVKGNKLTAYVNNQPIAGPFSILSEPSAVNVGYHADTQTIIDGAFAEVRILQVAASEIRPPPAAASTTPTPP